MFDLEKDISSVSLTQLKQYDIIEYGNENIQVSLFMVFDVIKDEKIPAILLQLWKFDGGYDHSFVNTMEVDFGLNKRVNFFIPVKYQATIEEINLFRGENTDLSEKEQFFFDLWPNATSEFKSQNFHLPFKVSVKIDGEITELVMPGWTPLQKIPLDKISVGSKVEIWRVKQFSTIMKVLKL